MPEDFQDLDGRRIQLTDEGWAHILSKRAYMTAFRAEIGETLREPDEIRRLLVDLERGRLYYKWYYGTIKGDKWVCVVVKILIEEAFVTTSYVTGKIRRGERLWPI